MKIVNKTSKTRAHNVLFRADLPFGHKVEKDRTKYARNAKHRNKGM